MKKKKEIKRRITLVISKKLEKMIEEEAKEKKITKTAVYYKILEKYFESKEKININPMPKKVERKHISIVILEKYAKLIHTATFDKKVTKIAFMEALIKDYFAILDK